MIDGRESQRILELLGKHRGEDPCMDDLEIVADDQIVGLYAIRIAHETEYLVRSSAGTVERVIFDFWPPQRAQRPEPQSASQAIDDTPRRNSVTRVKDLMSSEVVSCCPDDSLATAARLMWEHDCGCLPVCPNDADAQVVGMITDRDISMCAFFQGAPLTQLKVKDAMYSAVGACNPEDELETAEALMQQRQVRRLPVLDTHGKLLGILSLADLVRRAQPRNTAVPGAITGNQIRDTLAAICKRPAGRQAARSPSAAAI